MTITEKRYEKGINQWRIIYLDHDGDVRVDTYPYQSEDEAAEMLEDQLRHGSWKAGKLIQAKDFFKL